jgi:hypothetical protein
VEEIYLARQHLRPISESILGSQDWIHEFNIATSVTEPLCPGKKCRSPDAVAHLNSSCSDLPVSPHRTVRTDKPPSTCKISPYSSYHRNSKTLSVVFLGAFPLKVCVGNMATAAEGRGGAGTSFMHRMIHEAPLRGTKHAWLE